MSNSTSAARVSLKQRLLFGLSQSILACVCATGVASLSSDSQATEPTANDSVKNELSKNAWHEFRGDAHDGTALGSHPPLEWGEDKNMAWKTPIHGRGWSSPVVTDNEVWMTSATEDGKKMYAICVALDSGKVIHDLLIFENEAVQPDHHVTNSYASPTPVIEGENVWVHFGAYGTACLDRKSGKVVWQRRDLPCNHYRGPGSSPIIYRDLLIFHMDGYDHQYVAALNKKTGETVWQKKRDIEYGTDNGDYYKAYSTPLVIRVNGVDQMVSSTSKATVVLNPLTVMSIGAYAIPNSQRRHGLSSTASICFSIQASVKRRCCASKRMDRAT